MTIFLLGGQVLPFFLLARGFASPGNNLLLALLALLFALLPRLIASRRFRQPS